MRRSSSLFAAAFVLGACAPTRVVTEGPATAGPDRPVATPDRPSTTPNRPPATPADPSAPSAAAPAPSSADAVPTSAPDRWWLLDAELDSVRGTGVDRAYRELLAAKRPERSVVVAIIDTGVDIGHEDLDDSLWVNADEIPANGADDDGNGYADDVHGWNFIGGPDGRNVHIDTWEVTRLYAGLRERYEGADPDTLAPSSLAEYERYREVAEVYEEERAETADLLRAMREIDTTVDSAVAVLREYLGTDALTVDRVRAIATPRNEVRRARQVFLQLHANGITPAMVDEERRRIENVMEYKLNSAYDPRPIVGDRYDDVSERRYGNADVVGPDASHGTHVAGIIAAERQNGIGIDGIAPSARIMAIRAVPDGDERDKDIANAIRYAVDNGADIINMSFGKAFSPRKDVVDAAVRYADERGVLVVHAAGNDGVDLATTPNFPSRFYEDGDSARLWIEVGASSWRGLDTLAAPFSNYGRGPVHVFAPGDEIVSTAPDGRYEANSGTSMAAPVVSGLAALLMAYYPSLEPGEVKRIILDSAARYGGVNVVRPGDGDEPIAFGELSATGGIVNAYAAVRLAEERTAGPP